VPAKASRARAAKPRYFKNAAAWRKWLAAHHDQATELLVGMHRRHADRGMTWPESVDEALCFGWIDGVRGRVDEDRYTIRFGPRRPGSIWSKVNIAKAEALIAGGRMAPAGLAAYQKRTAARCGVYSFEQAPRELEPASRAAFAAVAGAAAFFDAQGKWYRQKAIWWLQGAKRPETRARRLARLVELSAAGHQLP